tara:strand:+ start:15890 stop:16123 length:234 start_codon:yes stop_codon:yes gene_type:complete
MYAERNKHNYIIGDSDLIHVHISNSGVVFEFKSDTHQLTIHMGEEECNFLKRKLQKEIGKHKLKKLRMKAINIQKGI